MLNGFRDFMVKGKAIDLAVAVVLAIAFGVLVGALVADLVTPLIAAIFGEPDFSGLTFTINESVFRYGAFLNALLTFVIIALSVYYLIVVPLKKVKR